jgi:hypothetical protein
VTAPNFGSQGDHAGTCISCLRPTGLRAAVEGEAGWIIALLVRLGMPRDQAETTACGQAGGPVPDGRMTTMFPICDWCAPRTGFSTALCLDGLDVPPVRQPRGGEA